MTAKEAQKLLGIRDDQVLLLKAALYPPDEAIGYWQQWKKHWKLLPNSLLGGAGDRASFAQIDTESQRILPLVFRNLEHTQDPLLPALKETYRVTWMRNQRLLQKAQAVVQALNDAKIPNMLLKGIPMSLHYYKDMGVRPMGDVDVLVPYEHLDQAVEILKTLGNIPNPIEYKYRHLLHAMHCFDEGGIDVDLHWQAFFFQITGTGNDEFSKNNREKFTFNGIESSILNDDLQLFHTIIHGTLEGLSTIRWIPDVFKIINANQSDVYPKALTFATQNNTDYTLNLCLWFLRSEFGLSTTVVEITKNIRQQSFLCLSLQSPSHPLDKGWRMLKRQVQSYFLFYQQTLSPYKFVIWLLQRSWFRFTEYRHLQKRKAPTFRRLNFIPKLAGYKLPTSKAKSQEASIP